MKMKTCFSVLSALLEKGFSKAVSIIHCVRPYVCHLRLASFGHSLDNKAFNSRLYESQNVFYHFCYIFKFYNFFLKDRLFKLKNFFLYLGFYIKNTIQYQLPLQFYECAINSNSTTRYRYGENKSHFTVHKPS